ncbi:MAG: DUF1684 domain-containing protein [Flavobacteriales bacterium]|nr:DUF1684 domain-containing protein [Flavobacteriales bacterium]
MNSILFQYMLFSVLATACAITSTSDCLTSHERFLQEQHEIFSDAERSPLLEKDREGFQSINYYPYDAKYCVRARWVRTEDELPFEMPTSTERRPMYIKYGELHFDVDGEQLVLSAYQNIELSKDSEWENYLFIPFNDLTNGETTYGGGRYLDFEIPETEWITLNLNNTYHPLCSYDHRYSCPIPPEENMLDVRIEAGVKSGINGRPADNSEH